MKVLLKESYAKRSRDSFILDCLIGCRQSALYVYKQNKQNKKQNYSPHVLQSCHEKRWTVPRAWLVNIARECESFVATHFVFSHKEDIYVVSQIADMCLADVIDETLEMTEDYASAELTQVSHFITITIFSIE